MDEMTGQELAGELEELIVIFDERLRRRHIRMVGLGVGVLFIGASVFAEIWQRDHVGSWALLFAAFAICFVEARSYSSFQRERRGGPR